MGLPPMRRPKSADRALELLDLDEADRRRLSAESCDEAAVVLRCYAVYCDRVYAHQAAALRYLRAKFPGSPEELAAAVKLDVLAQLVPRVGELAKAFEGLAYTKRRMTG